MAECELKRAYVDLRDEATELAGGLSDLVQRATVYHHVFQHSGGNHAFPLIAAHGALWARGYFESGLRLGRVLSWQYACRPEKRQKQLAALEAFANRIRDINRQVCVDTYANYHFTARFGDHPQATAFVSPTLLEALNRVHHARRDGINLTNAEMRDVFTAHFLHEQHNVVGPTLVEAVQEFRWPIVRFLALRPHVTFAFFPRRRRFRFHNFADMEERIERGLQAFDLAAEAGWANVVSSLRTYEMLPDAFFADAVSHFTAMRNAVLLTA